MSCERYAVAIADHACGAEIAPDAQQHLETCDVCRARFDEQRRAIASLDAELQQALAIEPSAHFNRDVLARIERRSSATPRAIWWTALAAAAVGLIAIGLGAFRSTDNAVVVPPVDVSRAASPEQRNPDVVRPGPAPAPEPLIIVDAARPSRPSTRGQQPRGSSLPAVEVIVAADQSEAIARYLALVRTGTLDTSTLAKEDVTEGEPPPLVVAPLAVEPLSVPEVEIGAGPSVERPRPDVKRPALAGLE